LLARNAKSVAAQRKFIGGESKTVSLSLLIAAIDFERPIPLGLLTLPNEAETLYARANARIHTHVWMDGHSANPQSKGMIEWRF
jgi:hypothetical protein